MNPSPQPPTPTRDLFNVQCIYPGCEWLGEETCQEVHDWHELVMVKRGPYEVRVDGRTHTGKNGSVFYYPTGMVHERRYPGIGRPIIRAILYLIQWKDDLERHPIPTHNAQASRRVFSAFEWMQDLREESGGVNTAAIEGLFTAVLSELTRTKPERPSVHFETVV